MTTHSDPTAWGSTTTLDAIAAWLATRDRVIVTTHVKPDGDAVGSTLALVRALNAIDPMKATRRPGESRAEAWYFGPPPSWLADIARNTPHRVLGHNGPPKHIPADAVVITDTGSWAQLEAVREFLLEHAEDSAIVDHHAHGDPEVAPRRVVDTSSAAACQPMAELCRIILGAKRAEDLPRDIATTLYLGLATDTGWFRHSNVDAKVMATAGALLAAGAENVWLYQTIEQRDTPARLRLLAAALASLEYFDLVPGDPKAGQLAVMNLTRADIQNAKAEPGESGGFVDFPQMIASVRVTALLTEASPAEYGLTGEMKGGLTKISLRSKPGEHAIDVNAAAGTLGGGGHTRAAGARVAKDLPATAEAVVAAVRAQAAIAMNAKGSRT